MDKRLSTPESRHTDPAELAEWIADLGALNPINWKELCFIKAMKIRAELAASSEIAPSAEAKDALRMAREVNETRNLLLPSAKREFQQGNLTAEEYVAERNGDKHYRLRALFEALARRDPNITDIDWDCMTEKERNDFTAALDEVCPLSTGGTGCWLIEKGSPAEYLRDYEPGPTWTEKADMAMRFSERPQAEAVAIDLHPCLKARVCEHMFGCGTSAPSAIREPGWCSVPVEPTQEMLDAGNAADFSASTHRSAGVVWRAMLNACRGGRT